MGKPAARVSDSHVCPMVTGTVPHVGGPIIPPGCPTVLIQGMAAARQGDMATCTGPPRHNLDGLFDRHDRRATRSATRRYDRAWWQHRHGLHQRLDRRLIGLSLA